MYTLVWSCQNHVPGEYVPLKTKKVHNDMYNQTYEFFDPEASLCRPRHIGVTCDKATNTPALQAAEDFVYWARNTYSNAAKYDTFRVFPSEDDAIEKLTSNDYVFDDHLGIFSALIVFKSGAPNWEYTVRFNQTTGLSRFSGDNPSTVDPPEEIRCRDPSSCGYMSNYFNLNYYTLTDVINSYFLTTNCASTGTCRAANISLNTLGGVDMPTAKYTTNGFWGAIGWLFALLMIVTLLYPLSNVIRDLVVEKETKLREGMMMMALQSNALWASWFFHFFCLFLSLSILLTIGGKAVLFKYSVRI